MSMLVALGVLCALVPILLLALFRRSRRQPNTEGLARSGGMFNNPTYASAGDTMADTLVRPFGGMVSNPNLRFHGRPRAPAAVARGDTG